VALSNGVSQKKYNNTIADTLGETLRRMVPSGPNV